MYSLENFTKFVQKQGRSLNEINPGSDEYALSVENSILAIELLKKSHTAILGGDILSEVNQKLKYVYQIWGSEFHYLNWSCQKKTVESPEDFSIRSYETAIKFIKEADEIAQSKNQKCYVVLVI